MSGEMKFFLISGFFLTAIMMMIPAFRMLMAGLFGRLLTPGFLGTLKTTAVWIFWILKNILMAHQLLLKNLLLPRSVIYKSLKDEEKS